MKKRIDTKLVELLKKHLPKDRFGQDQIFCTYWLGQDYFAGWYKQGDTQVRTYRITYPASSPAGFTRAGQSRTFDAPPGLLQ